MAKKSLKDEKLNNEPVAVEDEMLEKEIELDEELAAIESYEQGKEEADGLVAALKREKEEYVNMLKRERADFENYRKRNADLAACSYMNGVTETIKSILPVIDNLERALASSCADKALSEGIQMIQRQLMDTLSSYGLEEIEAQDQAFDPEYMNAVMQVEKEEGQESNCVAEVLQKGYKIKGKVIRCAMVKVTN
jgi:molecular chaperone GrpE